MVVMRMQRLGEKRGLVWASISVLCLIAVLLVAASISGGFTGLSGTSESLAYSGVVMVPLLLVIFLALRRSTYAKKKEQTVLASIAVHD
jgi:uncharacterized membrane protein